MENPEKRGNKPCPVCGATMDEFRKTGLLGCAHCYEAFRDELTATVLYVQGSAVHAGKPPVAATDERYDSLRELADERAELRERLDKAIRAGRYDEADRLQARLKAIHHKLYRGEMK